MESKEEENWERWVEGEREGCDRYLGKGRTSQGWRIREGCRNGQQEEEDQWRVIPGGKGGTKGGTEVAFDLHLPCCRLSPGGRKNSKPSV